MFSRKVQKSVLDSKANLKSVFSESDVNTTKHYFFRYNLIIRELNPTNIVINLRDAKKTLKTLIQNGMTFTLLKNHLSAIPRTLKNQSSNILRVWAHQCECVVAQRLRRTQQMFCLYTRLWDDRALKELLNRMRHQIARHGKDLMFGAIGVASYNWENNRIPVKEIVKYVDELEYINSLREKTVNCKVCGEKPNKEEGNPTNIPFCDCSNRKNHKDSFEDWVPFIERKDMVVWRRLHSSGQYEYKVYGSYNDVSGEDFLNVQIDTAYRRNWDTTAVSLKVVETDPDPNSYSDIVYWEMLWPKLFANRDYVFNRRFVVDCKKKTIIIVSKGTEHPAYPTAPDKYRVEDYWSYMVIKPYKELNKPGIEFSLTYFDNPGVNIPASITAWVAMKAMPDFLTRLREATKGYKAYCEKTGTDCICNIYKIQQEGLAREQAKDYNNQPPNDSNQPTKYNAPGSDVMISPSLTVQAEQDSTDYWKYLHPNYYFG